ncbi:MAG: hypothetical protein LBS99_07440 [Clostridiales bacterium]|nr:hypothetical protein [Clostridiales bacterium]
MKNTIKPLLIFGIIIAAVGSTLWLIFETINIVAINNHNLNVNYPTWVGVLGLVSIILACAIPAIKSKKNDNDNNDNQDGQG